MRLVAVTKPKEVVLPSTLILVAVITTLGIYNLTRAETWVIRVAWCMIVVGFIAMAVAMLRITVR